MSRQCRYCGCIFASPSCPDCDKQHERMGRLAPELMRSLGSKAKALTLDVMEGNSEEADGGQCFKVKDFRA